MATLRVVAVPDFEKLNNAIKDLKKTPIKMGFDEAASGAGRVVSEVEKLNKKTGEYEVVQRRIKYNFDGATDAAGKTGKEVKKTGEELKKASGFANLMGDSFGRIAAKMAMWQIMGDMIAKVRRAFSEALETMKAVDDELVTVRKVTGMTTEELAKVEAQAYKTASAYGVSVDAYLESVSAFARAGYKEQSADLAELSTKTQIVGDTTAEVANQMLLSVDAAYKYHGSIDELTKVLDHMNKVENENPTSIAKIADGLGIVAPVAAQLGVSIEQLVAMLGTITSVTQRSGAEASRALRSILINLTSDVNASFQDVNGETAYMIGEIDGLRDVVMKYAGDLYDAANATGKILNPVEVIDALAQAARNNDLKEQELYDIVTDESGKLRAAQFWALLQNWDTMYADQLGAAATAAGSAEKEVANALDSWSKKLEQVKNGWTEFISHIVDTEVIKVALDAVIDGLEVINGWLRDKDPVQEYTDEIDKLEAELEDLEAREGSLTETEEKRVSTIRSLIDALKERRAEEQTLQFGEWNQMYGTGNYFGASAEEIANGAPSADVWYLENYKEQLIGLEEQYHNTEISLEEFKTGLTDLNDGFEWMATALREAKDRGEELSPSQERLLNIIDTTGRVTNQLNEQLEENAAAAERAKISGAEFANSLLEENWQAGKTKAALYDVTAETIRLNSTGLNVTQKLDALRALAQQAGVAAAYIASVMNPTALGDYIDSEMKAGKTQEGALFSYFNMIQRHISATAAVNPNSYGFNTYVPPAKEEEGEKKAASSSSGKSEAEKAQAERLKKLKAAAQQAKKEAKEERDAEIKEIQDQIDALKERNKEEKEALELEKKKEDVLKKQNALLAAQAERTIRMYNAQTGQWEWAADASKVQKAQEALTSAKESLAEYKRNKAIEDEIAELEKRKEAIKEYYEEVESRIDKTLDGLESSTDDLTDAFRELGLAIGEQQQAVEEATEEAQSGAGAGSESKGLKPIDGTYTVDPSTGKYLFNSFRRKDDTPDKVVKNGREYPAEDFPDLFDLGGILHGMGGIKATTRDEIVIPPNIAEKMLSPVADQAFAQRMSELNFIYGNGRTPDAIMRSGGAGSVVNNSGTTYNLGGVTLTEQQAKTTSVYELAQLAQGLRCYS